MCQSQNTWWACRDLASGKFLICEKYRATSGRECDGYTSFSRVIKRQCPKCRRQRKQTPRTDLKARVDGDQASAGALETNVGKGFARPSQAMQPFAPKKASNLSQYPVLTATANEVEQQATAGADSPQGLPSPVISQPARKVPVAEIPGMTTRKDLDAMMGNPEFDDLFEDGDIPIDPELLKM